MDKVQEVVGQSLEIRTVLNCLVGVGFSHQVLGRIEQAQCTFGKAGRHFAEALQALDSIPQVRFETGRTRASFWPPTPRGTSRPPASNLKEAHSLFKALRVSIYVERVE